MILEIATTMSSSEEADSINAAPRPFLISFSGIDGAGKTTQIERLSSYLQQQGLRVLQLTFWDHVAVWPNMRAGVGHRAADLCQPNSAEDSFAPKNHKHIRNWYLTAARSGLYVLDVVRLRVLLTSQYVRKFDVVIFDRYIYDQIANVYSLSLAARIYSRALLRQTPSPDLAFILDTSPDAAFARKPEYPLDFMYRNRRNFLRLRELASELITIPEAPAEDVSIEIRRHIHRSRIAKLARAGKADVAAGSAVVQRKNSCRVRNEPTTSV
jgi:thymidylate kinase